MAKHIEQSNPLSITSQPVQFTQNKESLTLLQTHDPHSKNQKIINEQPTQDLNPEKNEKDKTKISSIPNCAPGLEYLATIDQLLVKQKVELLEAVTSIETSNKYKIRNTMGQDIFKAKENSDFCTRQCCGPIRCFQMEISDNLDREVLRIHRPLKCATCCFPCCLQSMEISSPISKEIIGHIRQIWHPFFPKFNICDKKGHRVLILEGPFLVFSCFGDVEFSIRTLSGSVIGKITKQWGGVAKETLTDADNFSLSFPLDLDVNVKASLMAAVFLIDFMYFEETGGDQNQGTAWG